MNLTHALDVFVRACLVLAGAGFLAAKVYDKLADARRARAAVLAERDAAGDGYVYRVPGPRLRAFAGAVLLLASAAGTWLMALRHAPTGIGIMLFFGVVGAVLLVAYLRRPARVIALTEDRLLITDGRTVDVRTAQVNDVQVGSKPLALGDGGQRSLLVYVDGGILAVDCRRVGRPLAVVAAQMRALMGLPDPALDGLAAPVQDGRRARRSGSAVQTPRGGRPSREVIAALLAFVGGLAIAADAVFSASHDSFVRSGRWAAVLLLMLATLVAAGAAWYRIDRRRSGERGLTMARSFVLMSTPVLAYAAFALTR